MLPEVLVCMRSIHGSAVGSGPKPVLSDKFELKDGHPGGGTAACAEAPRGAADWPLDALIGREAAVDAAWLAAQLVS